MQSEFVRANERKEGGSQLAEDERPIGDIGIRVDDFPERRAIVQLKGQVDRLAEKAKAATEAQLRRLVVVGLAERKKRRVAEAIRRIYELNLQLRSLSLSLSLHTHNKTTRKTGLAAKRKPILAAIRRRIRENLLEKFIGAFGGHGGSLKLVEAALGEQEDQRFLLIHFCSRMRTGRGKKQKARREKHKQSSHTCVILKQLLHVLEERQRRTRCMLLRTSCGYIRKSLKKKKKTNELSDVKSHLNVPWQNGGKDFYAVLHCERRFGGEQLRQQAERERENILCAKLIDGCSRLMVKYTLKSEISGNASPCGTKFCASFSRMSARASRSNGKVPSSSHCRRITSRSSE
jgi:hypothetical protein